MTKDKMSSEADPKPNQQAPSLIYNWGSKSTHLAYTHQSYLPIRIPPPC